MAVTEVWQARITGMAPAGRDRRQGPALLLHPLVKCSAPGNGQEVRFDVGPDPLERCVTGLERCLHSGDVPAQLTFYRADHFSYLGREDCLLERTGKLPPTHLKS